ncbi:Retrovirus-related Pol polyprotein from type-2 retrotransposable element R2DM [Diplonema papillatum]|nr:Retrovirus-related Pol polyprotein from type-2 retrotransposable element R2DM [Diplonema papillatum]
MLGRACPVPGDGNCQFSAISQRHGTVDAVRLRRMVVDEMEARPADYRPYMVVEPGPNDRELTVAEELARWQAYLEAMRRNATYGDELTLRAASRVLRCDIWVLNATSRETLRGCRQPAPTATIILTYRPEHYDAMLLPLPSQRLLEATTGDSVPLARLALVNAGPVAGTAAPTHRPPTGVPVAAQTRQQDTRPRAPGSRRPCDKLADLRSNLTVATFNVTSYRRHYLDVHGLDADLVALQEVRLDEASAKASAALVRQELGARLYVGKPLPLKRMGNGGLQAPPGGVAFHVRDRSTKVWQPPMGHAAERRLWETGRWQHLAVPYGDGKRMLHLMTVYAHARGRARREELLEAVFEVAAGLGDVPVLVMGDWNTAVEDSPALRKAVSVGHWTDAALLDAQRRGRQPESTCSQADGGTRIDMVFANAAAVGAVRQVTVTRVPGVPTHSAVVVDLNLQRLQATTGTVVRPAPIPAGSSMLSVEERGVLCAKMMEPTRARHMEAAAREDVEAMWQLSAQPAEAYLLEAAPELPGPSGKFVGRALTTKPRLRRVTAPANPLDGGAVNAHQQATSKLIRQIEAIERDSADVTGLKAQLVRKQRWDKARAGGKKLMADDAWAEVWGRPSPPVGETMMKMLADLRGSQKKLAHDVKETRINEWRRSMQLAAKVAPGRIFAWVKQADRRQVEYLARADGSVTWDAKEMDELLRGPSAWGGVYERHGRKETPAPKWEAFEKDFRAHIPRANAVELNAITAADLRKTLGTMKKNTAPGAEGWRVRELAALPDEALRRFAELFAVVEKTGKWPESLMRALVSLIPKGEGGSGPMDLRPISVTSAVYRLWAATRLRMLMEWMLAWVPEGMRGAIPKRGADDVMYAIGLRIEHAAECGKPLFGLSVDFMKCFDRLPHEIMFRLMEVMGLDPGVLRAMKAVYGSMQRHFKTARAVGEPFVATNGILQGCPLSVLFLNALIAVWVRAVGALTTPAQAMAYLDDIHAMSESLRGLKAVAEVTTDFANATDGGVNAGKSFFYATNADAPGTLTVQGNKVLRKTSFDVLGAMFTVGKGAPPPSRRIQTRFEAAKNIARRARSLPIPMDQKEGYVAASATAKALYGVSVWQPAGTYMEGLRVATLAGLWTGGNRRCDAVVLNTLCRGHRLDPRVAAIHRRVNTFSQQMVKQSHLAPLVVAIRAARQARRDRPPGAPEAPGRSKEGPVFLLERAIADIGWTWPRFDTLQEGTGRRREWTVVQNVEPLTKEERQRAQTARHNFQHELREAGRTMRYKDVVKTRASLLGIEDGIDGGATRDLLEKGAITGYQQGLVRAVIANAVHTGKRWEQATCRFCDAGVPEDEQHMWWDCVKWSDVRGAYPNVLARRPEMKPCMALCGVMPKDAMGLDFDECRELAAGMQLMCVEILLGRQRADGILEQDCRRKELKVSTYPWGWEPQRPTASQTINVDGARPDRNAWKDTHEMLLALAEWCSTKRWSETGKEASISYFELAVDFELHSGLTLTPAGTQRRQENIAQRQPKERWTVADTLPGEETAAFFDGGSRGNGTNGAVAGAGAVFYDKGVKQWEVEKPIAGRATNNVAEYVGFVSVLARLLRDPVPPTPRTIVVKGDSELVIGQIKGTKRCNETLRRYYDQAQNLLAKLHDRRTTIEPVHIPRELNKDADELSNRAMDTAQRQAAQAYSDSATAKGWAMRTALSRLGKIARVKAVHPALEMRVNHLTSLGGPILQGLNKRPQINNREAFEAVMRAFEVAAVRHVPKKMANKGRGDQGGHWEKAGVLTGSFRPQAHYPRGWQHSGEKWKARARHDRATHRRARGGGSRHLWDVLANAEKKKADAQRAGCRPGSSTNRPTAAAAAATAAATSTAATSRGRTEGPAAQHQSIPHAGGDGRGTLPRDDEGRGEPGAVK